jgi:glycosyltransferase involved in cell wall biosynthesis
MIYSIDFGVPGGVQSYSIGLVDLLNENNPNAARAIALDNTSDTRFKILHHHDGTKAAKLRLKANQVRSELKLCKDDTLILHDASTMEFIRRISLTCSVWIVLHGDYPYYYNTAKKFGLWADEIFAVNQHLKKTVEHNFRHHIRCRYLPAVAPKWDAPNFSSKKDKIIFVGRKTSGKGAHLLPLIDAYLTANGITYEWSVIASGEKVDGAVETTLDEWQNAQSSSRIVFHQDSDQNQIRQEYASSSIFILPSQTEGFPVSLIEAMSQGCVPLVFNYGPDTANQMPSGLSEFICNDWETMAQKIHQLHSIGTAPSRTITLEHFKKSHARSQTMQLLEQALGGAGPKWKNPFIFSLKRSIRKIIHKND